MEQQTDVCYLIADVNILCSYANIIFKARVFPNSIFLPVANKLSTHFPLGLVVRCGWDLGGDVSHPCILQHLGCVQLMDDGVDRQPFGPFLLKENDMEMFKPPFTQSELLDNHFFETHPTDLIFVLNSNT